MSGLAPSGLRRTIERRWPTLQTFPFRIASVPIRGSHSKQKLSTCRLKNQTNFPRFRPLCGGASRSVCVPQEHLLARQAPSQGCSDLTTGYGAISSLARVWRRQVRAQARPFDASSAWTKCRELGLLRQVQVAKFSAFHPQFARYRPAARSHLFSADFDRDLPSPVKNPASIQRLGQAQFGSAG